MRIATVYLGRRGGGNLYTFYLAKAMARIPGVQQKLFLHGHMENLPMFKQEGFDMEEFGTYGRSPLELAKIPFRLLRLRRAIAQFNPDVLYVPMFSPYIPFLFHLFPRLKKIYTLHGATSYGGRTRTLIENRWQEQAIAASDYVITLTRHYQGWMKTRFPHKKVFVLPHPALAAYTQLGKKPVVKQRYILFIGRIGEKYKGFEILHRAFEKIKHAVPLKLVIAGKKEPHQHLPHDPAYIGMDRWLRDEEFASLVRRAFVVCLPYTQPTPSGVVAVAMALGTPIIASDVPGLNEQILNGKNGLLVPAGDENALAHAIEMLWKNPKKYARLKKGMRGMGKRFSVQKIAVQLQQILKEVEG